MVNYVLLFSHRSMCPSKIDLVHYPEFMDILSHLFSDVLEL